MRRYVLGLCLDRRTLSWVTLIHKKSSVVPGHAGKLNGVGGRVRDGETFEAAVEREFCEETGCQETLEWLPLARLTGTDWEMVVFCSAREGRLPPHQGAEGLASYHAVDRVVLEGRSEGFFVVPDVRWLVPMAINRLSGRDASLRDVRELPGAPAPRAADPGAGGSEPRPSVIDEELRSLRATSDGACIRIAMLNGYRESWRSWAAGLLGRSGSEMTSPEDEAAAREEIGRRLDASQPPEVGGSGPDDRSFGRRLPPEHEQAGARFPRAGEVVESSSFGETADDWSPYQVRGLSSDGRPVVDPGDGSRRVLDDLEWRWPSPWPGCRGDPNRVLVLDVGGKVREGVCAGCGSRGMGYGFCLKCVEKKQVSGGGG